MFRILMWWHSRRCEFFVVFVDQLLGNDSRLCASWVPERDARFSILSRLHCSRAQARGISGGASILAGLVTPLKCWVSKSHSFVCHATAINYSSTREINSKLWIRSRGFCYHSIFAHQNTCVFCTPEPSAVVIQKKESLNAELIKTLSQRGVQGEPKFYSSALLFHFVWIYIHGAWICINFGKFFAFHGLSPNDKEIIILKVLSVGHLKVIATKRITRMFELKNSSIFFHCNWHTGGY